MNFDDLNKWMTLAANVGVVAGLALLAYEVGQNNDLLRAQARTTGEQNRMRSEVAIMENADLRDLLVKKNLREDTTPQEDLLLRVFQSTELNGWYSTWLEHRAGLTDIDKFLARWRNLYWYMEYSERWEDTKHRYEPEFVEWMQENIVERPPDNP